MAGTQAAGKHIMITLRESKKRSHKRSFMVRKVSKQHVFEVAFPCKHSRRDSEACTARDSKASECLDDFEGVFFMQPLLNYPNTTTPVFICSLSPPKASYLDHTVTMFFLGDAQEIADSGFETLLRSLWA